MRLVKLPLLIFLLFSVAYLSSQTSDKKQILIMHSYHQGLLWTDNISQSIRETFDEEGGNYELYFEYLDTKRNAGEEYFERLSEFEKGKKQLADLDFDIIISSDNDALRFLTEFGEELFGPIPIVFCGVNNYSPALLKGRTDITGIPESIDYRTTLNIMSDLHPYRSNVLFIIDRTTTGNAVTAELEEITGEYADRFDFQYLRDFSIETIGERIGDLGEEDLIYLLVMNSDKNGTFISYSDAIAMVRNSSSVPIYGSWDFFFGKGIMGGMMVSGHTQGKMAADLALRILNGENPRNIPVKVGRGNRLMFDYREMERYDIKEEDLPDGSFVSFKPAPFAKRYLNSILLVLATALLFLIILFINNRYQKDKNKRLAEMNDLLDERVKQALSEVQTLSGLLPICAHCKKIRDDSGYWNKIETYIKKHSDVDFSHGLCPDCAAEIYPKHFKKKNNGEKKT